MRCGEENQRQGGKIIKDHRTISTPVRISRIGNCYGLFDYWHRSDKFSQFCVFLVRACVRKWISKSAGFLWTWPWPWFWAHFQPRRWSGKESKSVFDFLNIGFRFLMRKLCISTDRMSSETKLMWKVTLITLLFGTKQILFAQWFLKIFYKKFKFYFFRFIMILSRINKVVYLCLFEYANTRKHVYEHSCSSVRVFWRILAHLAHLAQFLFFYFKCDKWIDILIHV